MTSIEKIKPLSDYLLIEPLEKETVLPSGIVVPDTAKDKPSEGKVLAVGPGKKDEKGNVTPVQVTVGSVIMYKKWGGTEIKAEGKDLLLVKEEDVIAIIEG
ncbi:MAG TPA: co-chaperone GroES [bacterium]|jgi:chaperonin GroES|nr:co-chaperone GroES [bacterium]HPD74098.1 co-chaperone GroES [bacterium]HRY56536.1 co-chaperone GroES [Patescibacteria group bacterium]